LLRDFVFACFADDSEAASRYEGCVAGSARLMEREALARHP